MADTPRSTSGSQVKSIERALIVLDLLAQARHDLSLGEIAAELGWAKSTLHGVLATLRDYHYVDQSPETGRYCLGLHLFELGNQVARSWNIREAARPVMEQLLAMYGETVQLATEENGEILYIEKLVPNSLVRIISEVGERLPMHCSGLGKVLLAQMSPGAVKFIIDKHGLPALTSRTITSPVRLDAELCRIRENGYALDNEEVMDGLRCVAAPIWDANGSARYAISVSGQLHNMVGDRLEHIVADVKDAAARISYAMGNRSEESVAAVYPQ